MKKITDVAKAANVSVGTVSKALNGYKDINEGTRQRILKIAEKMDYFPNFSAVQLVKRPKDAIGLILPMIGKETSKDEFLLGIISGVYNQAEAFGYRVVMFTSKAIQENNQNYVQFCHSNNLIGTIIHGLEIGDPHLPHLLDSEVPCVFIDMNLTGKKAANISINNRQACIEVVGKLVELGHKNILFISGSKDASVAIDRLEGFLQGVEKNKDKIKEYHIIDSDFSMHKTYDLTKEFFESGKEVTAIFCASDLMAVGAFDACVDLGMKIPKEVSIVGFDNLSFTKFLRPQLATVSQNFYYMGQQAALMLIDISNEEKEFLTHKDIGYELKLRDSLSIPPKSQ